MRFATALLLLATAGCLLVAASASRHPRDKIGNERETFKRSTCSNRLPHAVDAAGARKAVTVAEARTDHDSLKGLAADNKRKIHAVLRYKASSQFE